MTVFRVLGGVTVDVDGVDVALAPQARRLLGILLADRGRPVPIDVIVDRLWSGPPPATAPKVVHVVVGRLRDALDAARAAGRESLIATVGAAYRLDAGPTDLDQYLALLARAEERVARGEADALGDIEGALRLWCGRPWGDQGDDDWLAPAISALEERHRRAEEQWAELALAARPAADLVERLRTAAHAEPLRERRWGQVMMALYRSGRQAEALRAYEECRAVLREQLGLEPGPELRRLHVAMLQQEPSLESMSADGVAPRAGFVGRAGELAALDRALARSRIVTVVGHGGMGKTRLVAELAHRRRLTGETMWSAALATLPGRDHVAGHIAAELGLAVDEDAAPIDVVVAAVGNRRGVLVIDAGERAISETSAVVLRLLERCPALHIVVTSRVPFGLPDEVIVDVGPLPADAAFELLVRRIGGRTEELSPALGASLRREVERSGGVPLLLELAARTVETGTPGRDVAAAPVDHAAAVLAAIEHALGSVDDAARSVVLAAAPLPAGVCEETASGIAGVAPADATRALRQLTWVRLVDPVVGKGPLRYRSLDPVREALARDLPPEQRDALRARAVGTIEAAYLALRPDGMPFVLSRLDGLEDEHDNLRRLLDESLDHAPGDALRLACAAAEFWPVRGHIVEGRRWIDRALASARPVGEPRWRAEFALARTTRTFGEVATLRPRLEAVIEEMRAAPGTDPLLVGAILIYVAMARGWHGDREGSRDALAEARVIDREHGTPWTTANLDHLAGLGRVLDGDLVGARDAQREFGRRMEELDDPVSAAMGWYLAATIGDMAGRTDLEDDVLRARSHAGRSGDVNLLGQLLLVEGRLLLRTGDPGGRAALEETADALEARGGVRAAAVARRDLGLLELDGGDPERALHHLRRAVPVLLTLDRAASAPAVAGLALVARRRDDHRTAVRLAAVAAALRGAGGPAARDDQVRLDRLLTELGVPAQPLPGDAVAEPDVADVMEVIDGLLH